MTVKAGERMAVHRLLQRKHTVNVYPDRGLTLVRGEGVHLIDHLGNRYLDLMTNYGVNIFGYHHPRITEILNHQITSLTTLHSSFNNDIRGEAARRIVARCGGGISRVFFSNSGSEAVEAALKFAVLATKKKRFVTCRGGFHGKTLGALSANDNPKYIDPFRPLLWDFIHIDYGNLSQLEEVLDEHTAAFLVEPIQGEGGIIIPEKDYLEKAHELCRSRKILMIIDEIQTGVGRTGRFLASQDNDLLYDMICLGKGLAGGIPTGAVLVNEEVAKTIPRAIHTSTFGGNPLACAGVIAVLDLLDESLLQHIQKTGEYFLNRLRKLSSPLAVRVNGKGLMIGIDIGDGMRNTVLRRLQDEGILAIPAADSTVRFLPPFILENDHIDRTCATLYHILKEITQG